MCRRMCGSFIFASIGRIRVTCKRKVRGSLQPFADSHLIGAPLTSIQKHLTCMCRITFLLPCRQFSRLMLLSTGTACTCGWIMTSWRTKLDNTSRRQTAGSETFVSREFNGSWSLRYWTEIELNQQLLLGPRDRFTRHSTRQRLHINKYPMNDIFSIGTYHCLGLSDLWTLCTLFPGYYVM